MHNNLFFVGNMFYNKVHCILYQHQQGWNSMITFEIWWKRFDEDAVCYITCKRYFEKFKVWDIDISDDSPSGRPSVVNNAQVMEIIEQKPFSATVGIAEILNSSQQTISDHIRKFGLVYKYSRLVPHHLTEK